MTFANPPVIDAREGNAREEVELTRSHVAHRGHVPAANVLVEHNRILEHCASHTHATSNPKHTTPTEERGSVRVQKGPRTDSQGEVSKASEDRSHAARERTAAVGRRRG
jgi:hypothetical protein